ncbi:hypothetical protein ACJA88_005166 [Fusarium oxysporum]
MSSMEKDRIESDDQTMSSEEAPRRERRSKKKGSKRRQQAPPQQQQQQGGSGPLDQLPLAGDLGNTVGGVTDGVTNTLGGVTGGLGGLTGGQQQGGGGDAGKDTLRLRLDLNLDIEIQLKARIHGDLELSLLTYEVNVPVRNGRTSEPKVSNPEIRIPRIKPVSESTDQTDAHSKTQSQSPERLAAGLDGKYIDEFGNILDWDGTVLGRVEGDLPSMVGRPVMPNGQVLDEDGEVAGQVCENYIKPALKPLAAGGLKVDDEGNIYDDQGNRIGKLDKPMPSQDGTDKLSENKDKEREQAQGAGTTGTTNTANPKPPGAPRPDELFLDVKSTYDGIQLIIKIPTVFNRNLVTETKSSGSQTETTDSDNR